MIAVTAIVHDTATVHDDCSIGAHTRVWQFASILRGAKIGDRCVVGHGASVDASRVGDGCRIGAMAFLPPGIELGSHVFVGPGAIFCNDFWPRTDPAGFDMAALLRGAATIRVGSGASIGAAAIVLPGVRIGARAMIPAGGKVTADVPDDHLWGIQGRSVAIDPSRVPQRTRLV
jgi:acetyltransferase-like isoleucine patch superfamily enzyme